MVETNIHLRDVLKRATYSGSGDGLTGYHLVPNIQEIGVQLPTVADLFMQAQTNQPTVRYMRETSYTNAAGWVSEGTAKPEATFNLEEVDAAVRKAAVWTKVTDESFEDFTQLRPYIDQRLALMLRTKIDSDLLNGTGVAPQIAGLLGTSGIQTAEMASNTAVKLAEAIMNAITKSVRSDSSNRTPLLSIRTTTRSFALPPTETRSITAADSFLVSMATNTAIQAVSGVFASCRQPRSVRLTL